ncbi:MAG: aminotransferase class IV family protein [Gemmatimonadetes bacterium]|nr:aminotransferase class IV family protein [Gemmatimonadota bacterium]
MTALPAVWVDGRRQAAAGPHVSARDRGLTLADGVFETMRVRGGCVFRLDRHLTRLAGALAVLQIPAPSDLRAWVLEAAAGAAGADASLRLTVTRGLGAGGVAPTAGGQPTVIVTVGPLPPSSPAIYEAGLSAHVASGRRNERAMTAGLKTLAYTDAVAALLEATREGADEALLLDTEGHCSEATASNLFVWTGDLLVTPPVSCGALPGITRAAVLELARAFGVPTAERAVGLEELLAAKEALLTSTLRQLAPLVRVASQPIGGGAPGVLTRQLADAYTALVARECRVPRDTP